MKPETERRIDQVIPLILKNPTKAVKDYPTDPEVIRHHVSNLVNVSAHFFKLFSDRPEEHETIFITEYLSFKRTYKIRLIRPAFDELFSIAKAEAL